MAKSKKRKQQDKLKRRRKQILAQQQGSQNTQEKNSDTPKAENKEKTKAKEKKLVPAKAGNNPERKAVVSDIKKFFGIFNIVVVVMVGVGLMIEFTSWIDPVKDWINGLTE